MCFCGLSMLPFFPHCAYLLACTVLFDHNLTNFSALSSLLVYFLPPLCSVPVWTVHSPSAAASISAVTAGTHPASAAMLSYSILPVCVRVYVCVSVSKCFLTQRSHWISEWYRVTTSSISFSLCYFCFLAHIFSHLSSLSPSSSLCLHLPFPV